MARAGSVYPTFLTAEVDPQARAAFAAYERMAEQTFGRAAQAAERSSAAAASAAARAAQQASSVASRGGGAGIGLTATGAAAQMAGASRLRAEMRALGQDTRYASDGLSGLATGLGIVQGPLGPIAGRVNALSGAFRNLGSAVGLGAALGGGTLFAIGAIANSYQNVQNRLRPLYDTTAEFNVAFSNVGAIAKSTRSDLDAVAILYQRLALTGADLGKSQGSIARETELVSKAIRLSTSDLQQTQAAITQYAQGIGSGRGLGGDELRSIQENAPRLAKAIADGMGVTIGSLKQMGAEGALTAELVGGALASQANRINTEFDRIPKTIGQATTAVTNSFTLFIGRLNETIGLTNGVSSAMILLSESFEGVAVTGAAFLGIFAANKARTLITGFTQQRAAAIAVGEALRGMAVKNIETTVAAEAAAAQRVAALKAEQAQALSNIATIEAERAAYAASLVERRRLMEMGPTSWRKSVGGAGSVAGPASFKDDAYRDGLRKQGDSTADLARQRRNMVAIDAELAVAEAELGTATTRAGAAAEMAGTKMTRMARVKGMLRSAGASLLTILNPTSIAIGALTAAVMYYSTRQSEAEIQTENAAAALRNYGSVVDETTGKLVRMSAEQQKSLVAQARETYESTGRRGAEIQGSLAGQLRNVFSFSGGKASQPFLQMANDIEAGGAKAADAIAKLKGVAATPGAVARDSAKLILANNKASLDSLNALGQQQRIARNKIIVGTGGTDPEIETRNRERAADESAQRQRTIREIEQEARARNKVDRDAYALNKARDTVYGRLGGGKDIRKQIEDAEASLASFKRRGPASGGKDAYDATIERATANIGKLKAEYKAIQPEAERLAKLTADNERASGRAAEAARDDRKERAAAAKAERESEAARKKAEREAAAAQRDRQQAYSEFVSLVDRYDSESNAQDRANKDIVILRQRKVMEDENQKVIQLTTDQVEEQVRLIEYMVRKPIRDTIAGMQEENTVQQLIMAGREDEAALLQIRLRFLERGQTLTEEEAKTLAGLIAQRRQLADLEEDQQEVVGIYQDAARSLRDAFTGVFEDITTDGWDSFKKMFKNILSGFNRMRGEFLSRKLFGGEAAQDRGIERDLLASWGGPPATSSAPSSGGGILSKIGGFLGIGGSSGGAPSPVTVQSPVLDGLNIGMSATSAASMAAAEAANDNVAATEGVERATINAGKIMESLKRQEGATAGMLMAAVASIGGGMVTSSGGVIAGRSNAPSTAREAYNKMGKDIGTSIDKVLGSGNFLKGKDGVGGFAKLGSTLGTGLEAYSNAKMLTSVLGIKGKMGEGISRGFAGAKMGAQIGGPVGAAVGAVIGFGSAMLAKTKKASATLSFAGGEYGVSSLTGNSQSRKDASKAAGGSLGDYLSRVADMLGANLSDVGGISIGMRKDTYRVDASGQGRTKNQPSYKTEQEAIEAAVRIMLQRGVINGISAASQRILQSGQDLQKALEKAVLIESIPKRLKAMTNPIGAAIDELNAEFTQMRDVLVEAGASAEQFQQMQQLYDLERAKRLEQTAEAATNTLTDFLNELMGGTDSPLSPRNRLANAQEEYQKMRSTINTGGPVDQDKYQKAAENYRDAARDLFGSTPEFFAVFNDIAETTRKAITNLDTAAANVQPLPAPNVAASPFTDPTWMKPITDASQATTVAIDNQTRALIAALGALGGNVNAAVQQALLARGGALAALPGGTGAYYPNALNMG